jgi:hypothetical protein
MRQLILTKEFEQFLLEIQSDGDKFLDKTLYVLDIIRQQSNPSKKFLKKLTNIKNGKELFEVRVSIGKKMYRILCFFPDENYGNTLVLLNGFKKQDDKTLKKHTSKAVDIIACYLEEKKEEEEEIKDITKPIKQDKELEESNKSKDDKD